MRKTRVGAAGAALLVTGAAAFAIAAGESRTTETVAGPIPGAPEALLECNSDYVQTGIVDDDEQTISDLTLPDLAELVENASNVPGVDGTTIVDQTATAARITVDLDGRVVGVFDGALDARGWRLVSFVECGSDER